MIVKEKSLPNQVLVQLNIENCQKWKENIGVAILEAVESIDGLNIDDELDQTALFSESNTFVFNINNIIYHLRILLLHVFNKTSDKQNLLPIIQELVEIAYHVSNGCSAEPAALQSVLKTNLQNISDEAEKLFNLVKIGAFGKCTQDYLDVLNDLLLAIDRIRIRYHLIHKTPEEIFNLLMRASEDVGEAVKKLVSENEFLLADITHYIRHSCQHMQNVVHYLHEYGRYYEESVSKEFLHASREMHRLLNMLQEAFQAPYNVRHMTENIDSYVRMECKLVASLTVHLNGNDSDDRESIKEAVYSVSSKTLANTYELARRLRSSDALN